MSEPSNSTPYDAKRIFAALIVLTALEVAWGIGFHHDTGRIAHVPSFAFWSGLIAFALIKGLLILLYFMHLKFEKLIVWTLVAPTPILIVSIVVGLMPDVSYNDQRDHPVGSQLQRNGRVVDMVDADRAAKHVEEATGR